MTIYLLNSPVLTAYGAWRFEGPLALEQARAIAGGPDVLSAIGHETTALWLSSLLGLSVPCNRRRVEMAVGDRALVLRLLGRLPERGLLDLEGLEAMPHEFGLLTRTA